MRNAEAVDRINRLMELEQASVVFYLYIYIWRYVSFKFNHQTYKVNRRAGRSRQVYLYYAVSIITPPSLRHTRY